MRLIERLQRSADRFGFFELVRLLEYALGTDASSVDRAIFDARIVFAHSPDLAFPGVDVASWAIEDGRARVETTFLGLVGTGSPLPPEWTEQVLHDDEEGALRNFYDVFHHRALSLLYGTWKEHALEGGFDLRGDDPLSKRLRSLAGVDGWADEGDEALPPMAAVGLADYQRGQPQAIDLASAESLLQRLYPAWNVRLQGGIERHVPLSAAERTSLGAGRCRLGEDLVYGSRCAESESLVRVHVGPVDGATYESLMPGGKEYGRFERLTRRVFADAVDLELEVEVAAGQSPVCALGRRAGGRLGVDTRYAADRNASVRVRVRLLQDAAVARRLFV